VHWVALREAWWPMAVAVAWVFLRSRPVVEQLLDRHPRKPITFTTVDVHAAALKAGGQHTTPELENSEAAFRELRYPLEAGEIEIVGTPFVRVSDRQGSSRLEMGNQQTIFYTEISSLVSSNDQGDLCLIPRDWRAAHGSARTNLRGYRNVLIRSAALVRAFPEERTLLTHVSSDAVFPPPSLENITVDTLHQSAPPSADPSHQTGTATPSPKRRRRTHLTPLQEAVIAASMGLWPDGKTPASAKQRNAALVKELKKISGTSVSDSTIRRALRVHGRKKRKLRSG
jgi:hypothetical protein